jgi:hypothetical protein
MIRLDTGGGAIATFVIVALIIIGGIIFIQEVIAPIICWGPCT